MGAYVVVAFAKPVRSGLIFPRSHWPLHITLVRFDTSQSPGAVASRLEPTLAGRLGFDAAVGGDDFFGRNRSVPVSLVEPEPQLQLLHEALLDALGEDAHVLSPHHTRGNFRPHISHQAEGRLRPGELVHVDQAALVDMHPGGDTRCRKSVAKRG